MSKLTELTAKLSEILQIDRPDLDFGIYRVINARADEIRDYLARRLPDRVKAALGEGGQANLEALKQKLAEAIAGAQALDMNADDVGKVRELRQQIEAAAGSAVEYENAVYSHLLTFFSRYYDQGDFISQRRYKGDTYAIPYAGEEVVLHWANKDQYYTKSGENFSNYSFRLEDDRLVHFRLIAADTAKDNRKDNDKERRFVLIEPMTVTRIDEDGETFDEVLTPVAEEDGALVLRFAYQPMPQGTKQAELLTRAIETVLADAAVKARWQDLTRRAPTEKSPLRTVLEKHLTDYAAKNTADYFIHKDLGGFLRRELDFYIKNEVMNLDDVQNAAAFAAIETQLRTIQTLRTIALDLIAFLAQLENFQKRLWLKKKFVVAAHYCVTLNRVSQELYPAIAANAAQWAQWHDLGMRASPMAGTVEDLKTSPFLMVDTALFDARFRADLLKTIADLDAGLDGLLVHCDNFQAASLLHATWAGRVKHVYIDPPYNTGDDGFAYKDSYRHSSWMSMLDNRVREILPLLRDDGIFSSSIDRDENRNYLPLLFSIFGEENFLEEVVWKKAYGGGSKTKHINNLHEYIHQFARSKNDVPYLDLPPDPDAVKYYKIKDKKFDIRGKYRLQPLNTNSNDFRKQLTYPIPFPRLDLLTSKEWDIESAKIGALLKNEDIKLGGNYEDGWQIVHRDGSEWAGALLRPQRQWQWSWDKLRDALISDEIVVTLSDGDYSVSYKQYRFDETGKERGRKPSSVHVGPYTQSGTDTVRNLFGYDAAKFPKPVGLLEDIVGIGYGEKDAVIADFFAGSGTTGEAVVSLNRSDDGRRKYILSDQSESFDRVLKARMQKVVFSASWANGKATAPDTGISHAFKVLKIEGYEDTLNNLALIRTGEQTNLLDNLPPAAHDDYLLRYMMNVEARASLLSVADFRRPFDYKLRVAVDSAGAAEVRAVDLVETFNYLLGLAVKTIDLHLDRGFALVQGVLPDRQTALVLWRDCDKLDYEGLLKLCETLAINPADSEHDVVYVNGDHTIPTVATADDAAGGETKVLKLRQIEPAFLDAMFSMDEAS
ncbi:site-specific DNA-methyltransferase [Roseomonas sp. USHLN139]|uniref:site-specific DNA-methyltransferase n=1 Tax=Roseomonas sp. USHLN139 TaxID=3081298 RepID=UPI003B0294FD